MNSTTIEAGSGTPLFAQVRDVLRLEILRGTLPPGTKLPSESELSDRFKVSRITVRQALSELQEMGLVTTVNGKGSYVTRPGGSSAHGPLVGVIETMRKRGYRAYGRLLSVKIEEASAQVAAELATSQGARVGAVSVLRYRDDVPFQLSTTWCSPTMAEQLGKEDLSEMDVSVAMEEKLLMRIERTSIRIEAALADGRLARRMRCEKGSAILRIRVTNFNYEDEPFAFSISESRGEMMDYRTMVRNR